MPRLISAIALGLSAWTSSQAATLLPDQSIYTSNDLTVVHEGDTIYQLLDLTALYGISASSSIAAHTADGFRWATASDMSVLLSAFNISYSSTPGDRAYLVPADGTAWTYETFTVVTSSFISRLGYDPGGAISASIYASGFVSDPLLAGRSTYLYINSNAGLAFVSNEYSAFQAAGVGTFLVRNSAPVPEPATGFLMVAGLLVTSLALSLRKRFRSAA